MSKSDISTSSSANSIHVNFNNRNSQKLPIDKETKNYSREVKDAIFSKVLPSPLLNPKLVAYSKTALELVGLSIDENDENELVEFLSGNKIIPGSEPVAHCYCGHQFGSFAGQLGDGAAISLGEIINTSNERWELQLKGAGPTPYSRHSDGRKVLRSSIREFLASEYMHGLGIPTTRAGTCITSDSTVVRDPMYDGRSINEPCTVISRIAPNFFRFGSFEIFKPQDPEEGDYGRQGPSVGNEALKKQLLDHVLQFFPELLSKYQNDEKALYIAWFKEVTVRSIRLVAQWQAVGFIHGVLNTDNMSIMGLTIDYGPYAFMESYDPDYVSNGSDGSGKYAFKHQPKTVKWNLQRLAEAIDPLMDKSIGFEIIEEIFDKQFNDDYINIMSNKLGISPSVFQTNDPMLIKDLLDIMEQTNADYTDTFYALTLYIQDIMSSTHIDNAKEVLIDRITDRCFDPLAIVGLLKRKMRIHRLGMQPQQVQKLWELVNKESLETISDMFNGAPGSAVKQQIEEEKRKLDIQMTCVNQIDHFQSMDSQYKKVIDKEVWTLWIERYIKCLSLDNHSNRLEIMKASNPSFMLRNWILQDAIDDAHLGKFEKVRKLVEMSTSPYDPTYSSFNITPGNEVIAAYCRKTPENVTDLICTCSS